MATYGLVQVHEGENAKVDIVFLHGLRGDMTGTWTKDGVLWPNDLLPKDIPESRIFLFGYDSGITHLDQSSVTKTEIHSDAEDLCAKLAAERSRTKTEDLPIVFVAHSLGGLVAAQVLVHGARKPEISGASSISKNVRGMIFLGTPFRGSSTARPAEIARSILQFVGVDTQERTLKLLGVDSERLDELTRAFTDILDRRRTSKKSEDRIQAFFFYETLKTRVGIRLVQIVEVESAKLQGSGDSAPIRADHVGICKFKAEKDEGYSVVVAAIRKVMLPLDSNPLQASKTINILGKAVNVANDSIYMHNQTNNL